MWTDSGSSVKTESNQHHRPLKVAIKSCDPTVKIVSSGKILHLLSARVLRVAVPHGKLEVLGPIVEVVGEKHAAERGDTSDYSMPNFDLSSQFIIVSLQLLPT